MSLDRRAVLKGLAAGGVLVVGGGLVAREVLDDADPAPPPASSTVPPPPPPASMADALLAVGTRYLEADPDEAEQELLLDALPALQGGAWLWLLWPAASCLLLAACYACLGATKHTVTYHSVARYAYLSAKHTPFTNLGRTCHTHLGRHHSIGAYLAVVCHLHEVVKLNALAHNGRAHG